MWLLNATTRKLELYQGSEKPKYAVLSHRWEEEEVSFDDLNKFPETMKGYRKIDMCCLLALARDIEYVWVDTCCIDKKSSAELSEAINSMYQWYGESSLCFAYLFDSDGQNDWQRSTWFTRGWTLQELIAPDTVMFYDGQWDLIGTKHDLVVLINDITGVPEDVLRTPLVVEVYSIAERMSWAARRQTTREEDRAYSLLGIFDINMPLIYGEGIKAFQRLQEEIMKYHNDLSLFAWECQPAPRFGMLAASPTSFAMRCRQRLEPCPSSDGYTVNNTGLSVKCYVQPLSLGIHLAYLHDWKQIEDMKSGHSNTEAREIHAIGVFLGQVSTNKYRRLTFGYGMAWVPLVLGRWNVQSTLTLAALRQITMVRQSASDGGVQWWRPMLSSRHIFYHYHDNSERFSINAYAYASVLHFAQQSEPPWRRMGTPWKPMSAPVGSACGMLGYLDLQAWDFYYVNLFLGFDDRSQLLCIAQKVSSPTRKRTRPRDPCPTAVSNLTSEVIMDRVSQLRSSEDYDQSYVFHDIALGIMIYRASLLEAKQKYEFMGLGFSVHIREVVDGYSVGIHKHASEGSCTKVARMDDDLFMRGQG